MPDATPARLDSIRLAADGKNLIVTDAYYNKAVYRVNPDANVWTMLLSAATTSGTAALTDRVRDALEAPDGTLYVASSGGVRVFDANLDFVKKIDTATSTGLALDVDGNKLFYSTQGGIVSKYDISTGTITTLQNRGGMGNNNALQLIWRDGQLLVSDARNYYAYEVNPDAVNDEDVFLSADGSFTRYAFIDENAKPGFVLSFR